MPIDDAMDDLEVTPEKKKEKKEIAIESGKEKLNRTEFFKDYGYRLIEHVNKNYVQKKDKIDEDLFFEYFNSRMYFGEHLEILTELLDKSSFLEILKYKDPETYEYVTLTTYIDKIPDIIDPLEEDDFSSIPKYLKIPEIMDLKDLRREYKLFNKYVLFQSMEECCLFMDNGDIVKKYLDIADPIRRTHIGGTDFKNNFAFFEYRGHEETYCVRGFSVLHKKNLMKFHKQTGIRDIEDFILSVDNFFEDLKESCKSGKVLFFLYNQLNKNHPELLDPDLNNQVEDDLPFKNAN